MKLFKKTAALLFCLALIVSVMAISASADDEAQLLLADNGTVTVTSNSEFEVMLTKKASDTAISRDGVSGYEINADQDVTFDITVAYTGNDFAEKTIDAVQFDFKPGNNYGATLSGFTINYGKDTTASVAGENGELLHTNIDTSAYFDPSHTTENTYAYTAAGSDSTDISMPGATALTFSTSTGKAEGGTVIGTITVSFDHATQAIDIYPQIENLLFHVRGVESSQQPSAASTGVSSSNGSSAGISGTISGGKPVSDGNSGTSPTNQGTVHSNVIKAPIPVIVNPIYTVTLEKFQNNATTGILEKVTGASATDTLKYDFTTGSFQTEVSGSQTYSDGTYNTALSNDSSSIYGYTLQGWMVTTFGNKGTNNDTWAEYNGSTFTPNWTKTTSYPATTDPMSDKDEAKVQWGTNATADASQDTWYNAATGTANGRKEFVASYTYLDSPQAGVNFIPATKTISGSASNYTYFPAGLVGDITLTPVYTRDVYTATFKSGDDDATFGIGIASEDSSITVQNTDTTNGGIFTKQYTIEDLTANGAVDGTLVDFLTLNDPNGETALQLKSGSSDTYGDATGSWGVSRKAYKFMGWTPSVTAGSSAPASGYRWTADTAISSYNSEEVIKAASYKHYGDVTFTAVWEEDIYYAEIDYQYAGTSNVLVLVAVPNSESDNYSDDYTYTFKPSATASAEKMFLVADSAHKTAYIGGVTGENGKNDQIEKFPTTTPSSYVLFAYIANPDSVDEASVEIDEAETNNATVAATVNSLGKKCANYELKYNGDVDGSGSISVADFGNVDTLLNDGENADVFAISNYYGVRARLEAHVDTTTVDTQNRKFASIGDVKTIYNLMGYNVA